MNPVQPSSLQSAVDTAPVGSTVYVNPGNGPAVTIRKRLTLTGVTGLPTPVLAGLRIQGDVAGLSVHNIDLDGGGIESIDGLSASTFSDMRIQNCSNIIGCEQSSGAVAPIRDVTFRRIRGRNATQMGTLIGSAFGVKFIDCWMHKCGVRGNTSTHGWYLNDASAGGSLQNCWATECATGFRGTLNESDRLLAYKCDWGIATSGNASRVRRPIALNCLNGGGVEVNAGGPVLIEQPYIGQHAPAPSASGLSTTGNMRTCYLQVRGGVVAGLGASAFNFNASPSDPFHGPGHGDIADVVVADGALSDTQYAGGVDPAWYRWFNIQRVTTVGPDPTRTPERYAAEVLEIAPTLDALWEHEFELAACHSWLAAGVGL